MKKKLILVSSMLLSLSLLATGCGETADKDVSTVSEAKTSEDAGGTEKASEDAATGGVEKSKDFVRGTVEENVYSNAFSGLTFNAPEDYVFGTDEELAAIMGVGADILSESTGQNYNQAMLEIQNVYDMMGQGTDGSNVIAMFENLGLVIGGSKLTHEEYLDLVTAQLTATGQYTFSEPFEVKLGEEVYTAVEAKMGDTLVQHYMVQKIDKYMSAVIITAATTEGAEALVTMFE